MDKRQCALLGLLVTCSMAHPVAPLQVEKYGQCDAGSNPCDQPDYYDCVNGYCEHKPFWPVLPTEWLGYVVITLLMSLCNVAGIGGGAID